MKTQTRSRLPTGWAMSYHVVLLSLLWLGSAGYGHAAVDRQPVDHTAVAGTDAVFVFAYSTLRPVDLVYQWYRDDVKIDGAVDPVLRFPCDVNDAGLYHCTVASPSTPNRPYETSNKARLTVLPAGTDLELAFTSVPDSISFVFDEASGTWNTDAYSLTAIGTDLRWTVFGDVGVAFVDPAVELATTGVQQIAVPWRDLYGRSTRLGFFGMKKLTFVISDASGEYKQTIIPVTWSDNTTIQKDFVGIVHYPPLGSPGLRPGGTMTISSPGLLNHTTTSINTGEMVSLSVSQRFGVLEEFGTFTVGQEGAFSYQANELPFALKEPVVIPIQVNYSNFNSMGFMVYIRLDPQGVASYTSDGTDIGSGNSPDVNGDGVVNADDLQLVIDNFGIVISDSSE